MSGIYSRKIYDNCDYDNLKHIAEGAGQYTVNSDLMSNSEICYPSIVPINHKAGYRSMHDVKNSLALTEIESHLLNLDMKYSNCENNILERNNIADKLLQNVDSTTSTCKPDVDKQLTSSNTRMDSPSILLRDKTLSRFDFPIVPHTSYFYDGIQGTSQEGNNRFGVNSRLIAKDNFKA